MRVYYGKPLGDRLGAPLGPAILKDPTTLVTIYGFFRRNSAKLPFLDSQNPPIGIVVFKRPRHGAVRRAH